MLNLDVFTIYVFLEGCENTDSAGKYEWQPIIDCRNNMNLAVTPPGMYLLI